MNFINALLSGKPFKRPQDATYFNKFKIVIEAEGGIARNVGEQDLAATDWDTKRRESVINANDVTRAMRTIQSMVTLSTATAAALKTALEEVLKVNE